MNAKLLPAIVLMVSMCCFSSITCASEPIPDECIQGLKEIEKAYSRSEWKYEVVDDGTLVCSGFRRADGQNLQHEFQYVDEPQKVAVYREGSYFQLRKQKEDWVPRKLQPATMKHERFGPSYLEDTYEFDRIPIVQLLTRNQQVLSAEEWRTLSHGRTENNFVIKLGRHDLRDKAELYLQPKKSWACEKILLDLDSRISSVELFFDGQLNGAPALSEMRKVVDGTVVRKVSFTPISNSPDKAVFTLKHYGLSEDLLQPKGAPSNSNGVAMSLGLLGAVLLVTAFAVRSKKAN